MEKEPINDRYKQGYNARKVISEVLSLGGNVNTRLMS